MNIDNLEKNSSIMAAPTSLRDFKDLVQASFSNTLDELDEGDGAFFDYSKSLKVYLIENNNERVPIFPGFTEWKCLDDANNWLISHKENDPHKYLLYDNSLQRVGVLYTMLKVTGIDKQINYWIEHTPNLDHCWLSRKQLLSFSGREGWEEKGIGLRYRNVLEEKNKGEDRSTISLKAWYGSGNVSDWKSGLDLLREKATISSVRWRKSIDGDTKVSSEWYNYGKVTVSFADDVEDIMQSITIMAQRYYDSLTEATKLRDNSLSGFELNFTKPVDINAFSDFVAGGKSSLKLWMIEVESEPDLKRFRGVDMHTWDLVYLDLASDYAYLSIPGNGCVNAAPRIAVIQGENTAGDTSILFNGVDLFD